MKKRMAQNTKTIITLVNTVLMEAAKTALPVPHILAALEAAAVISEDAARRTGFAEDIIIKSAAVGRGMGERMLSVKHQTH